MIYYLSLAGSGTSDTLERALIAAVEAAADLCLVAVIDDQQFADVDAATLAMIDEELDFLLRAQLVAVKRRMPSPPEGRVIIHRGTATDAVAGRDLDQVLIGGPLGLDDAAITELVADLERKSGALVRIISD